MNYEMHVHTTLCSYFYLLIRIVGMASWQISWYGFML